MSRSTGGAAPLHALRLHALLLVAVLNLAPSHAGPLGPTPNVTGTDVALQNGDCAVGQAVYAAGASVPGAGPCERCACDAGQVRCAPERCQPRPGCKALHRPDHCCPTYQCDCEQEGRVYANGEKLVDPKDPCRVCYCQGGEVVCRRIACFVRDDCRPRLVPGRCCPEYDNCPLRGVTTLSGVSPPVPGVSSTEESGGIAAPAPSKEPVKQEITIKEITRVSEIPVQTAVKIKEVILSSPADDMEYPSSKSPLIPREATSERVPSETDSNTSPDSPDTKSTSLDWSAADLSTLSINNPADPKSGDVSSSKITLPTQDHADAAPKVSTIPHIIPTPSTTKAPMIEEDDTPFEVNPAFPPIPDDLSVVGNHEDDIDEQPNEHESNIANVATAAPLFTPSPSIASSPDASYVSTESFTETTSDANTSKDVFVSTQSAISRGSSMLNLRSTIPKEILDAPSLISNESTGDLLDVTEASVKEITEVKDDHQVEIGDDANEPTFSVEMDTTVIYSTEETTETPLQIKKDDISSATSKLGEITSQTEFSSIPIETSDQNPHEFIKDYSDKVFSPTTDSPFETLSTRRTADSEVITILAEVPSMKDDRSYEYVETTEFIVTPYDPRDSATEAVELIKISPDGEESSAIILRPKGGDKNDVLADLINLVGDVASIPDHTDKVDSEYRGSNPTSVLNANSEELIPVNAGYKSKNSNWNLNSITEMPFKSKSSVAVNKQRVVEIEDDDSDDITDSPPPDDRAEPTTRRPTIDNVSDAGPGNGSAGANKNDIEIITRSYVPTINRRPTKVILQEDGAAPVAAEGAGSAAPATEASTPADTTATAAEDALPSEATAGRVTEHASGPSQ